jgi:hypothetical protein
MDLRFNVIPWLPSRPDATTQPARFATGTRSYCGVVVSTAANLSGTDSPWPCDT